MNPASPPAVSPTETLTDYAARSALYFGDRLAIVDVAKGESGRFTFRQMDERAGRLAAFLLSRGVRRGERVGLLAQNGVEYLDALLACAKLGAIFVPYNFRLHPRELLEVVQQTTPRAFVFSPDLAGHVELLRAEHPALQTYLHTGHEPRPGSLALEEVLARPPADAAATPEGAESVESPLCLLFTGGTTGLSKAAVISHRMIAWNSLTTLIHELSRDDVTVVHTPMFHTGGLLVYAVPLFLCGGRTVILRKWDVDDMLTVIERERVTMFFCVPTQYQMMLQSPRLPATRFDSVRFVTSGGAPLPVPVIEAFRKIHDVPFKQGFGMTEFGPGCFSMGAEFAATKAGSIGRPNAFVAARIVDEEGRALPVGEAGELLLKGPSMCSGYYESPEASRAAIDPDGWFHTGDVARVDADGFFFIVDRKKDMFISGGENVYPVEIERALYEHPAVHQCAVVGVPDEKWGQVGRAFVVLKPGTQGAPAALTEALLAHLRERLARYKVPKSVRLLEAMPVSPAGKILKRSLPSD
ncbi:MAG: long-chain fatty acid--CoA ligase [Polyangia bacterium]